MPASPDFQPLTAQPNRSELPAAPVAHPTVPAPSEAFLTGLLVDLRAAHFTPPAMWRFLARSWQRSWEDVDAYPWLVGGLVRSTLWLLVVAVVWLLPLVKDGPQGQAVLAIALVTAGLVIQQGFVLLHLGMVQPLTGGPRCASLGIANGLTLLRMLAAWLLLAYGVTGVESRGLLLGVFAFGVLTDAVDGLVARRVEQPTRLGRFLDASGDTLLFSVGALVLMSRDLVPAWLAALVLVRYAIPLAWAFVSYFGKLRPVRYAPTFWGRSAGVVMAAAFAAALLDPGLQERHAYAVRIALWLLCFLLCAAMTAQLWLEPRRWREPRRQSGR